MRSCKYIVSVGFTLLLGGCGLGDTPSCTSSAASEAVAETVKERLSWLALETDSKSAPPSPAQEEQAREIVSSFSITVENAKQERENNKQFTTRIERLCYGEVTVVVPSKIAADPDLLNQWNGNYHRMDFGNRSLRWSGSTFYLHTYYNLQQTDDGAKVVAELAGDELNHRKFGMGILGLLRSVTSTEGAR